MNTLQRAIVMVALLVSLRGEIALATPAYQITDLGTLGGTTSFAFGVNVHGDVVGSSTTSSGAEHAFLYHSGALTDLGVLNSGDTFSRATGINDSGIIVGQSIGSTSSPFYYSDGSMHFVGSLGGNYGSAIRINNPGQIVGISADANGVTHAFRYTAGTMTNLGSFSGGSDYSIAYGINSTGDVTGYSTTDPSADTDAFLYAGGSLQDLGNLGGSSRGFAINDAGYIVGDSIIDSNGDQRVFVWHNGNFTSLGTTAGAVSVTGGNLNNLNQVVGTLVFDLTDGTKNHGFLYSDGLMVDVNNLLPADSGWVLRDAQSINDKGQIVGFGNIEGQQHAYLLTPIPEPTSLALIASGAILFAFFARRRSKSNGQTRTSQYDRQPCSGTQSKGPCWRSITMGLIVLVLVLTVGCDGKRLPVTEYDNGYNRGITHVREGRQAAGPLGDLIVSVGTLVGDNSKSADWNAGYRAGVNAELDR